MLVSKDAKKLTQTIGENNWLKYSIELSIDEIKPLDIPLYTKQYDLDIIIIDLENEQNEILQKEYKQISKDQNVSVLFINPHNSYKNKVKKVIGSHKLFQ